MKRTKAKLANSTTTPLAKKVEATEQKDGILIRDLWKNGTDSVHHMRVLNIDAKSCSVNTPEKCLQEA